MTDNQIQYSLNAKKSIALCKHIQRLVESVEFYKEMLNVEAIEMAEYELSQIKNELDVIWTEQVDLFFAISEDSSRLAKQVFMESIRKPSGRSSRSISINDY